MMHAIKQLAKDVLQEVLLRGRFYWRGDRGSRSVYLTFDDGPDPLYTGQVLDILRRFGAKASFYLIGKKAEQYPDIVRRIAAERHAVGNHTYSHPDTPDLETEIDRAARIIGDAAQCRDAVTFRPPRGIITARLLLAAKKHGLTLVFWNVDSEDWRKKGIDAIGENIRPAKIRGGDVLLFHDNNELTVKALPGILEALQAKGFSFSAIDDLVRRTKERGRPAAASAAGT